MVIGDNVVIQLSTTRAFAGLGTFFVFLFYLIAVNNNIITVITKLERAGWRFSRKTIERFMFSVWQIAQNT